MMLKSLWVALSTYSAIPVPQFEWDNRTTKYVICFFPVVGVFCGLLLAAWYWLCSTLQTGGLLFSAVAAALPLLITGGIHMDGYMDTVDALSSHQSRERKLEIMKDSHCGAFAVIYCGIYLLLMVGLLHELYTQKQIWVVCPGYILSRSLSGLCAVNFSNARKNGMLADVTQNLQKNVTNLVLSIIVIVSCCGMVVLDPIPGFVGIICAFLWVLCYRHITKQQFGGVTGDTMGFFLQICEMLILAGIWMGGIVI